MADTGSEPRRRGHLTLRMRLTLLYGACFLVAGALVLAITYGLVAHDTSGQAQSYMVRGGAVQVGFPTTTSTTQAASTTTVTTPTNASTTTTTTPTDGSTTTAAAARSGKAGKTAKPAASRAAGGLATAVKCRGVTVGPGGNAAVRVISAPSPLPQKLVRSARGSSTSALTTPQRKPSASSVQVPAQVLTPKPGQKTISPELFSKLCSLRAGVQSQVNLVANRANTALRMQRRNSLSSLLTWSGSALGLLAIISILLGWLLAGRALKPLQTMTARAQEITAENLHQRLAVDVREDELGALANTFDQLLARLELAFDSQKRFVANASHELRTPLTLERTLAEVALADPNPSVESLRRVCERVVASTAQQQRLLEALLTLARSQGTIDRYEPLDLAALTEDAITARKQRLTAITLRTDLQAARISGNPTLVERLLANLLDNALAHNRAEQPWIEVATGSGQGHAWVRVANSGQTIAPEAARTVFEPFRRLTPDRTSSDGGFGLGLSIVEAIVTAHGGTVTAVPTPGGGLTVEARFPDVGSAP